MKFQPRSYQPPAIDHLLETPRCALWADMGLGKSVATATALSELIDSLETRKVLIVAPLRVARMVWPAEFQKWDHLRHLPVTLIRGTPAERKAQLADASPIHIINFENLKWLVQALGGHWPYDTVVLDESSKLRNQQSWRFKALKHVRPAIQRMIQLSGTPAPNGLDDVWAPVWLLDRGERLGRTRTVFRDRWLRPVDRDERRWVAREGAVEEVTDRLRDLCFTLRAEDYLDLPPLVVNTVRVELADRLMDEYRRLERVMLLELSDGREITATSAAAVSGKCMQYANGAVYYDEDEPTRGEREFFEVHDGKLEALEEVIESAGGEPVMVAYQFRSDLARLKRAYPQARTLDDEATEAAWNRGEIPILLVHPRSAGHGLNLQFGGRHVAFFGLTWSLEDYEQLIERIGPTRQLQAGTPRPVYVHLLVAAGTVDELVVERLVEKASVQDVLKKGMRRTA